MVKGIADHTNITTIWESANSVRRGNDIGWNPTGMTPIGPEQVPTTAGLSSDPMITLGHELSHLEYSWAGNQHGTWYNMTVADKNGNPTQKVISTPEIYTTHLENRLRSENNLPLRTHYGVQNGQGYGPRIINPSTGTSRYFNSHGVTNYNPIKRGVTPFKY
ncbi:MAG: type III secretion system effector protein [Rikenellaceae bacterium]|nr:type III secretion system effector protein [Rikenellaceae bacterium]